ncbi:MAG: hypothetical protein ACUVR0_09055 [Candidatus Aminicenantales bacterium]
MPGQDGFDILANTNLNLRRARGLAFIDDTVTADEEYVYEFRGLDKSGLETIMARSKTIKVGHFILPEALPTSGHCW